MCLCRPSSHLRPSMKGDGRSRILSLSHWSHLLRFHSVSKRETDGITIGNLVDGTRLVVVCVAATTCTRRNFDWGYGLNVFEAIGQACGTVFDKGCVGSLVNFTVSASSTSRRSSGPLAI